MVIDPNDMCCGSVKGRFHDELCALLKNLKGETTNVWPLADGWHMSLTTSLEDLCTITYREKDNVWTACWHFYQNEKAYFGKSLLTDAVPDRFADYLRARAK